MARGFSSVERFVERIVGQEGVDGAGIAVAVEGEAVFECVRGEAGPGRMASGETLWPLASISKAYSAAAIMSLIEEGRLGMWWRVSTVFPEFQGDGREEITLRHLLTHTSGLRMGPENGSELEEAEVSAEEFIAHVYADPLLFAPGTGQSYTDSGYGLAGLMAAKVAGVSFPELVRTRVLEPAGLNDTFLVLPAEHLPRVARIAGTLGSEAAMESYSSPWGTRLGHPAFGVVASVSDLLRFLLQFDARADGGFLSRAAMRTMSTDQTESYRSEAAGYPISKWGAGFQLQRGWGDTGFGSSESYGHFGGTGCVGWIDPVDGVSVAFVSNKHWSAVPPGRSWREEAVDGVSVAFVSNKHWSAVPPGRSWREEAVNVALGAVTAGRGRAD